MVEVVSRSFADCEPLQLKRAGGARLLPPAFLLLAVHGFPTPDWLVPIPFH